MNPFTAPRPKASVIDAIEGFYLAHTLDHFHRSGVLDALRAGATPDEVATRLGIHRDVLTALLEFLVERSDVVVRDDGHYALAEPYASSDYCLGFQLDKFVGGYGPAVADLAHSLRASDRGCGLVDRVVEADAYDRIGSPPSPVVLSLMESLGYPALLDVGCGPGTTLAALAEKSPSFRGWGVDRTAAMCLVARSRIERLGFGGRVQIIHDDARNLEATLPAPTRDEVEVVHSKGLMNELFGDGDRGAVAYISELRRLFPERMLLNVEYYGKLGRRTSVPSEYRHTLVHDVIQALTGQGVPPADRDGWAAVYDAGGAHLEHAFEGDSSGIEWCVHVVQL